MNTVKKIIIGVLLLSPLLWREAGGEASAQNTFRYKICEDAGSSPRWILNGQYDIPHQTPSDSGYVIFGEAQRDWGPPSKETIDSVFGGGSATKLDKYGNVEWIRIYREFNGAKSNATTAKGKNDGIVTSDKGFAIAGVKQKNGYYIASDGSVWPSGYAGGDSYVQKMDKDGHIQWAKYYKISTTGIDDNRALNIRQLPDSGFIVLGETKDKVYSEDLYGYDYTWSYNTYLLRLDKNGNKLWCYYYDAKANGEEFFEWRGSLEVTADGGYMITGLSRDVYTHTPKLFGTKGFMMKVSADGATVEWARRYGTEWKYNTEMGVSDYLHDTKQTFNEGYISVGSTQSGKTLDIRGWVVKTNALGKIEWQRTYDTFSGIDKVVVVSDGYLLVSNDYNGNNGTGTGNGRLTKINTTGEVQWSKLYDLSLYHVNKTMDKGFIMALDGSDIYATNNGQNTRFREKNVIKTNALGEFDNGCVYNDSVSSWVDPHIDTVYNLTPVALSFNTRNVNWFEDSIMRDACPVLCNISSDPTLTQAFIDYGTVCANTEVQALAPRGNYSHYALDFGDPASGAKNYASGSIKSNYYFENVFHNYSNPGSYTIKVVIYNNDYSGSDTILGYINVVSSAIKYTLLTPKISVCKNDTVNIQVQLDDYTPNSVVAVYEIGATYNNNSSVLPEKKTYRNTTLTSVTPVLPDTLISSYLILIGNGGCVVNDTVKVITGDNQAIISGNTEICSGGATTLNASGGNSYLWSTGATTSSITVSPSSGKTYWVEAATTSGCRDTGYVYVKVNSSINVELYTDKKSYCAGEQITLYAQGAQSYEWSNGSVGDSLLITLTNGLNYYLVTGKSGVCSDTASITMPANTKPTGSISSNVPVPVCSGTTFTVTASGGDTYYWHGSFLNYPTNPIQTFTVGDNEYAWVLVYNNNGLCADTVESFPPTAVVLPPSVFGIEADQCRVCSGTSVILRKYFTPMPYYVSDQNPNDNPENQGLSYQWSTTQTGSGTNDSIQVVVNSDTLISLTTTNSYGCSVNNSIRIQAKPNFFIKAEPSIIASCDNTPTTLYLQGDPVDDFTWSNGSKEDTLVVFPLQDTIFKVTATADGCTRNDSVWVKAKSNLPEAVITGDAVVCKGLASTYTASGNAPSTDYLWLSDYSTGPAIAITTTKDTTIQVVVTFTGACKDTADYKISATEPKALITGDTVVCPGGATLLKASGGYTYQWNTGSSADNIRVTALTDTPIILYAFAGNCVDTATVIIKTDATLTATVYAEEDTICSGTAITLFADGGDDYIWSTGEKNEMIGLLPSATTTYTVSVANSDNCKDTLSITITVNPSPTITVSGLTSICYGQSIALLATSSQNNFLWSTGATTASVIVYPINDSVYSVITSGAECSDSLSHAITVTNANLNAGDDQTIVSGTEVTLIAGGGNNYNWSTIDGVICSNCNAIYESPTQTTTYYLTEPGVTCGEDSVTIYVLSCDEVFVPNAFSPNNDGANDVLYLKNDCIRQLDFKIFDRWGNKVFESTNVANGWDGTYKEKEMNAAVFVYYVNAVMLSGEPINRKGNVSLIR